MWGICSQAFIRNEVFLAILMQRVGVEQSRIISDRSF
jgi:hypothetical protein